MKAMLHIVYGLFLRSRFVKNAKKADRMEWAPQARSPEDQPRERSRSELGDTESRGQKGYYRPVPQGIRGEPVYRCGLQKLKFCVAHVRYAIKWDKACRELWSMYMTCLGLQADIICGENIRVRGRL